MNQSEFISKKFDTVIGPVSVAEMSASENNQIFYLFGDHHEFIRSQNSNKLDLLENSKESDLTPGTLDFSLE